MIKCGNEAWLLLKYDENRIVTSEILRGTAGCTKLDKMRNTDIWEELKIGLFLENIQSYRNQ